MNKAVWKLTGGGTQFKLTLGDIWLDALVAERLHGGGGGQADRRLVRRPALGGGPKQPGQVHQAQLDTAPAQVDVSLLLQNCVEYSLKKYLTLGCHLLCVNQARLEKFLRGLLNLEATINVDIDYDRYVCYSQLRNSVIA